MTFGEIIVKARKSKGLSQKQLASLIKKRTEVRSRLLISMILSTTGAALLLITSLSNLLKSSRLNRKYYISWLNVYPHTHMKHRRMKNLWSLLCEPLSEYCKGAVLRMQL